MTAVRLFHRWLGLFLSLLVIAIAFSGGILIFHDAALRYSWPELTKPIQSGQEHSYPIVLTELMHHFQHPGIRSIRVPIQGQNAFHLWLQDDSEALVHPITGKIIDTWNWDESVMDILFEFHVHLFAGDVGEQINGVVGVLVLGFMFSGILLWWPRRKKWCLRAVIPQTMSSLHYMRSHSSIGVIFSISILLIVSTGITMVYYTPIADTLTSLLDSSPRIVPSVEVTPREQPIISWVSILRTTAQVLPEGKLISVSLPSEENAVITVRKQMPGEWHPYGRSFILLNPYTGEVLQTIDAQQQPFGMRLIEKAYPLHASKIGSIPYTLLALSTSGALVLIGIFGIMSFVSRTWPQRKKQKSSQNPIHILDHEW